MVATDAVFTLLSFEAYNYSIISVFDESLCALDPAFEQAVDALFFLEDAAYKNGDEDVVYAVLHSESVHEIVEEHIKQGGVIRVAFEAAKDGMDEADVHALNTFVFSPERIFSSQVDRANGMLGIPHLRGNAKAFRALFAATSNVLLDAGEEMMTLADVAKAYDDCAGVLEGLLDGTAPVDVMDVKRCKVPQTARACYADVAREFADACVVHRTALAACLADKNKAAARMGMDSNSDIFVTAVVETLTTATMEALDANLTYVFTSAICKLDPAFCKAETALEHLEKFYDDYLLDNEEHFAKLERTFDVVEPLFAFESAPMFTNKIETTRLCKGLAFLRDYAGALRNAVNFDTDLFKTFAKSCEEFADELETFLDGPAPELKEGRVTKKKRVD